MIIRDFTKALAIIVLICPTQTKGQHADIFKPMDIFEMESVSDPQISPDGSKILYVRSGSDIMTDKRYSNIWIINSDGTDNRPITNGQARNGQPRWSPDGTQIIYVSGSSGSSQVHKRWMDSGETTVLTNVQTGPHGISWSSDGPVSYTPLRAHET